jgi:hypothetical protein
MKRKMTRSVNTIMNEPLYAYCLEQSNVLEISMGEWIRRLILADRARLSMNGQADAHAGRGAEAGGETARALARLHQLLEAQCILASVREVDSDQA